jgi:AhpD family alkylhydroperoxidase
MTDFPIHTPESAPAGSKALLEATQKRVGRIANVYGALAEAPIALEAYDMLGTLLRRASFTPTERHVVWFTINAYHDCHYCMAAHTLLAKAEKVPEDVIGTARAMGSYDDPKFEALRVFTLDMVDSRGFTPPEGQKAFLAAGFTRQNVLEIITVIAHKVLSNYTNHIVEPPLDKAFAPFIWTKPIPAGG